MFFFLVNGYIYLNLELVFVCVFFFNILNVMSYYLFFLYILFYPCFIFSDSLFDKKKSVDMFK